MGKPTGFMEYPLVDRTYEPVEQRLKHYHEFVIPLSEDQLKLQGARCMDCGIPFCHQGCPVNNIIPDWNDLVYHGDWQRASEVLHSTNNFPEFTGRICPAPCQEACTLNIEDEPVTIKSIECAIVDKAFEQGWIQPQPPAQKTGKRVAVVGSGPAGMACAQQLARAGHDVVLFEKADRIGGLLRYGIPDFKMDKPIIDRRMEQMAAEGVEFRPNTHVGVDIPAGQLLDEFDAVALTGGAEQPRDLPVPGRDLDGVHFAMEFLPQQNRRVAGDSVPEDVAITAKDKHVIVIGGGDTGSDCIGTSNRQGAKTVTQLEIMPKPPEKENKGLTWPEWPNKLRTSSSHEEGCERMWSVTTRELLGDNGRVNTIRCARVEWSRDDKGAWQMSEVPGSEFDLKADLVLLAMGFTQPVHQGMLDELGVEYDARGNVKGNTEGEMAYYTSLDKVFAAGDMRRGQSLVVWAIREGRQCARAVDEYLMGTSDLPR
ncbi:glutamate synthase subunit beta [Thiohalobacter thiocyanaticus]|uniref:Glutamate synthase subunit beta n=1 Tax=Thiohalobacter thiocyanaticus TaxID=585455 RepID=A0A426QJX3_9GAMM|nr:glutamate synthase subunit beta [Thiohalobacter thiocyanaticus]RRQ22072.1 glutamate synthase subunit beta [Thiohalobacter thiocyanaticus]